MRIRPRRRAAVRPLRRVLSACVAARPAGAGVRRAGRTLTPPGAPTPWPAAPARHWQWQWQLSGPLDPAVDADVFLLDPVATTAARDRRAALPGPPADLPGARRLGPPADPDASRFPAAVRGAAGPPARQPVAGRTAVGRAASRCWPTGSGSAGARASARWRSPTPTGTRTRTGFPLDFDDQLLFNRRLAELARSLEPLPRPGQRRAAARRAGPGLRLRGQRGVRPAGQCAKLLPFTDAGKPVFHVEYTGSTDDFCVTTVGYGFASIRKDRDAGRLAGTLPAPLAIRALAILHGRRRAEVTALSRPSRSRGTGRQGRVRRPAPAPGRGPAGRWARAPGAGAGSAGPTSWRRRAGSSAPAAPPPG